MKLITVSILLLISTVGFTQSYPGYRSSDYSGVNSVFSNPANIADSRYHWNVNLFSIGANVSNSQASFSLSNLNTAFSGDADSIFFGNSSKKTNGLLDMDFIGPSVMFNVGRKNSFAITTRARVLGTIHEIDGNIIQSINDDNEDLPITLNSNSNQKIILNGWSEIGGSFGRVLYNKGNHFLKAGITLKYLIGASNSFANIDNLKGTLDENSSGDVYLTNATGRIAIGVSGIDFDEFDGGDIFKSHGNGVGFDLGLVYEYRKPGSDRYKFRAGISLMDLGSIKYEPRNDEAGDYSINIPSGMQWFPSDLDNMSITEIKNYMDASPYFTNNAGSSTNYKASLPTTVHLSADLAITKHFFASLEGQFNVTKKDDIYSSFYYNSISLTPRFETHRFGVYVPINYSALSDFNMGAAFRAGPAFIGSGSVLTALLSKSKQADIFFGVNFGGFKKR